MNLNTMFKVVVLVSTMSSLSAPAAACETTLVTVSGNLDSRTPITGEAPPFSIPVEEQLIEAPASRALVIVDSIGQQRSITAAFYRLPGASPWAARILVTDSSLDPNIAPVFGDTQLAFGPDGERTGPDEPDVNSLVFRWNGGGLNRRINVRFDVSNLPSATNLVATRDGGPNGCRQQGNLDFDGDGYDDFAIWRPSLGMWAILKSSVSGTDLIWKQWGLPGDFPMPGDYTGDGKADLVVWRPNDGNWYVCKSDLEFDCNFPTIQQFGLPGDVPIEGDFDGDGILDFAVWRPSNGNFYYRSSFNTEVVVRQWGLPGDIPLQGGRDY